MSDKKRHIVLITNWFPPKQGVAVARMLGFVRYLNAEKNTWTVLTDGEEEVSLSSKWKVIRVNNNPGFSKLKFKAGESKFIHLSKVAWNVALSRLSGTTDHRWASMAAAALQKIHQTHPIDCIISSYAPSATHLAAWQFCKQQPEIKWIADMRDEMSLNPHLPSRERKELAKIEKLVNERADACTTVSSPILEDFKKLLPGVRNFEEIRNGFDHNESFPYQFNEVFTISYAGTFYGAIKPDTFFEGLRLFLQENAVQVKLQFVGTHRNFHLPDEFRKDSTFIPRCPANEALKWMAEADANLLLLPKINRRGVYSGKIFDYISVRKPVIAVIDTTDVAADLLGELNAGFIADFDDPKAICKAIASAYYLWAGQKQMPTDGDKIKQLHRRYQVERLEKLINKITGS